MSFPEHDATSRRTPPVPEKPSGRTPDEQESLLQERAALVNKVNEHLLNEITLRHEANTRLERTAERLSQIIDIQRQLTEVELDLPRFMRMVVERMQDLTPASGAVIELVEGDEMVYRAASGSIAPHIGLRLKRSGSLSGLCVAEGRVLLCEDTATDPRVDHAACVRVGAGSMVVSPLQMQGRTVGVLKIMAPEPRAFSQTDVQTLQLMAGLLGSALAHRVDFEEKGRLLLEAEKARQETEIAATNFLSAAEANMDAFFIMESVRGSDGKIADFRITYINAQAEKLVNQPRHEVIGQLLCEWMPVNRTGGFFEKYVRVVETGEALEEEFTIQADNLSAEWLRHEVIRTADGICVSTRDVTKQKRAELNLVLRESMLRTLADAIPAQISFIGRDERYRYCNQAYFDVYGVPTEQIVGRHIREFLGEDGYVIVKPYVDRALGGERVTFERGVLTHGEQRYVEVHYIPQQNSDGTVSGFYVMVWDITQAHQRELQLKNRASVDTLTGLLNRAAFMENLEQEIHHHFLRQQGLALLFLDVDRFKEVNDTLGHAAGDELLKAFAERLRDAVRVSDHVARLGGDEFVILLTGLDSVRTPTQVADKLLQAVRVPVDLGSCQHTISTSIGIAYAMNTTVTPEQLLVAADCALYQAKAAGRNAWQLTKLEE